MLATLARCVAAGRRALTPSVCPVGLLHICFGLQCWAEACSWRSVSWVEDGGVLRLGLFGVSDPHRVFFACLQVLAKCLLVSGLAGSLHRPPATPLPLVCAMNFAESWGWRLCWFFEGKHARVVMCS